MSVNFKLTASRTKIIKVIKILDIFFSLFVATATSFAWLLNFFFLLIRSREVFSFVLFFPSTPQWTLSHACAHNHTHPDYMYAYTYIHGRCVVIVLGISSPPANQSDVYVCAREGMTQTSLKCNSISRFATHVTARPRYPEPTFVCIYIYNM